MAAKLMVILGPESGVVVPVRPEGFTIGRGAEAELRLSSPAKRVSRRHLHIQRVDDRWTVQDLGSQNGSYLDGAKIPNEPRSLPSGAVIRVGEYSLLFEEDAEPKPKTAGESDSGQAVRALSAAFVDPPSRGTAGGGSWFGETPSAVASGPIGSGSGKIVTLRPGSAIQMAVDAPSRVQSKAQPPVGTGAPAAGSGQSAPPSAGEPGSPTGRPLVPLVPVVSEHPSWSGLMGGPTTATLSNADVSGAVSPGAGGLTSAGSPSPATSSTTQPAGSFANSAASAGSYARSSPASAGSGDAPVAAGSPAPGRVPSSVLEPVSSESSIESGSGTHDGVRDAGSGVREPLTAGDVGRSSGEGAAGSGTGSSATGYPAMAPSALVGSPARSPGGLSSLSTGTGTPAPGAPRGARGGHSVRRRWTVLVDAMQRAILHEGDGIPPESIRGPMKLLGARRSGVLLLDGKGELMPGPCWRLGEDAGDIVLHRGPARRALQDRSLVWSEPGLAGAPAGSDTAWEHMWAPLLVGGKPVGVLQIDRPVDPGVVPVVPGRSAPASSPISPSAGSPTDPSHDPSHDPSSAGEARPGTSPESAGAEPSRAGSGSAAREPVRDGSAAREPVRAGSAAREPVHEPVSPPHPAVAATAGTTSAVPGITAPTSPASPQPSPARREADLDLLAGFADTLAGIIAHQRLRRRLVRELREHRLTAAGGHPVVGSSPAMRKLLGLADRVASLDAPVLILGEPGTGKTMLAVRMHHRSRRSDGPLVKFDCARKSAALIDCELFGFEDASGTFGPDGKPTTPRQTRGLVESAHGGTLLMEHVEDLPPGTQAKLLALLDGRLVERVGGRSPVPVDVRIIAASDVDLTAAARAGRFRADLLNRLAALTLVVPALRDRADDIPELLGHFVDRFCRDAGRPVPVLSPELLARLKSLPWGGNVRRLRNAVERLTLLSTAAEITPAEWQACVPELAEWESPTVSDGLAAVVMEGDPSTAGHRGAGAGSAGASGVRRTAEAGADAGSPGRTRGAGGRAGAGLPPAGLYQGPPGFLPPMTPGLPFAGVAPGVPISSAADSNLRNPVYGGAAGGEDRPSFDLEETERRQIILALQAARNSPSEAARLLGIARGTLYRKMERYGLRPARESGATG